MGKRSPIKWRQRVVSLDILRLGCALAVFLTHWHLWCDATPQSSWERGIQKATTACYDLFMALFWPTGGNHPAVLCFMVLSGFCIHRSFVGRSRGVIYPDWSTYYRRRFFRVYPVYLTAGIIGTILVFLQWCHPVAHQFVQFNAGFSWTDFPVRFAGIAGLYPKEMLAGNAVLASVATEMVFYAGYPAFYHIVTGFRRGWIIVGGIALSFYLMTIPLFDLGIDRFWLSSSCFVYGIFWVGGAYAAYLLESGKSKDAALWVLLTYALFLAAKTGSYFKGLVLIRQFLFGLVCISLLNLIVRNEDRFGKYLSPRWQRLFKMGADASYSLYAVHNPAILIGIWIACTAFAPVRLLSELLLTLGLSIIVTLLVYFGIERRYYKPLRGKSAWPSTGQAQEEQSFVGAVEQAPQ
jgi:peptidoglycan/LPS O-acetylase OafA/YrhL